MEDIIGMGLQARKDHLNRFILWSSAEWQLVLEQVRAAMRSRRSEWRHGLYCSCSFDPAAAPWLSGLGVTDTVIVRLAQRSCFGVHQRRARLILPTSGKEWEIYEVVFRQLVLPGRAPVTLAVPEVRCLARR